ncbi:helix-turn-helix domain-containing protein [Pseudochryseolinea flava]|uniref:AraC family transcriptional regulator n=1 Tax=Pseudochryseolinea flava TaxID=2059302 RepID=A0A364XX80_9BACT|nr:helix-turn-helix domain-containing protein [Pseudochryseolinea flava]RAV99006.1 AraC family transcriptional regulator [Pseudochryseolinea flava]
MQEKRMLTNEDGELTATTWMCDDIKLGHGITRWNTFGSFDASNQNDVVRLHFGLKGDYTFTYHQLGKKYDLIGGHHNIMYSKGFDMTVENKTLEIETFGVQFPKETFIQFTQNSNDLLKRFTEQLIQEQSVILSDHWGVIDASIEQVILQVIHSRYTGDLQKLFLLSKSIELLVLSAEACSKAATQKETIIKSKTDKEKIIAVRDLINDRVTSPPNLSEIAKTVGLNEYKLKRGFKETFNNTIFGYLTEQRLNLAHQYLLNTDKTAAEISTELGYATPQHFNNAFKKKFGITPVLVRKTS